MAIDAVLIAGPTASGKSALAVALAQAVDGTIINADSMQIYGEARILTARPPEADTARVPHLLYSHVSVNEPYSAGRYQAEAAHALNVARNAGRIPIFTGGTGLYFSALLDGLAEIPPVPAGVRARVRARREAIGADAFHAELAARDPQTAARLRASDTQRTLRAYEVFEATGRPLIAWQSEKGTPVLEGLRLARFVISPERSELHTRIERRFDGMVAAGAVEEAVLLAGWTRICRLPRFWGGARFWPPPMAKSHWMRPKPAQGGNPAICQAADDLVPAPHGRLGMADLGRSKQDHSRNVVAHRLKLLDGAFCPP